MIGWGGEPLEVGFNAEEPALGERGPGILVEGWGETAQSSGIAS
jgi:hypothetical protein